MPSSFIKLALAPIVLVMVADSVGAVDFRGLGHLAGGADVSGANGVSADGSTVVGLAYSSDGAEAFRWTAQTGMIGLGDLPGGSFSSGAWNVSADGSVVVGTSASSNGLEAFRWEQDSGITSLGDLPGGSFLSVAHGVSADGSIVVGYSSGASGQEAFRWTTTTGMQGIGDLPGGRFSSAAAGVSADGTVIVGVASSAFGTETFRFTENDGITGLGALSGGAFFSGANAVSADGSVVVGNDYSELPGEAFRWTLDQGMVGLGFLDEASAFSSTEAFGVSADGMTVVGASSTATSSSEAFWWNPVQGIWRLSEILEDAGVDLEGWQLSEATGISDTGDVIVGRGVNPDGQQEAWMVDFSDGLRPFSPGNANSDSLIDRRDLQIVASNFGSGDDATFGMGDFNADGLVSLLDLGVLQRKITAEPGASSAVPEPTTGMMLLLFGVTCAIRFRRRTRR